MGRGEQRVAEHSLSFVLSVKSVKSVVNSVFCFRLLQTDRFKRRHLPIEASEVWTYPFHLWERPKHQLQERVILER